MSDHRPEKDSHSPASVAQLSARYEVGVRQLEAVIAANKLHISSSNLLQEQHSKHITDTEQNLGRIRERVNRRIRMAGLTETELALVKTYQDKIDSNGVSASANRPISGTADLVKAEQWVQQQQQNHRPVFLSILIDLESLLAMNTSLRRFNADMDENLAHRRKACDLCPP